MKKKLLLITLLVALLACAFAISVSAEEASIPEWPSEVTVLDGMSDKSVFGADGTVGATSRVLMSDGKAYPAYYIFKNSTTFGITFTELSEYSASDIVRLEVPKGVVKTDTSAMKTESGFTALQTVVFPEGFTTLGGYTFKATSTIPSALVYVTLPSTLTTIGQNAFIDCTSLKELVIPEGVTSIPKEFAKNATSLKKLVLPSSVVTLNEGAFRSCDLSDGIVIPEGCKTIGKYAFKGTNATSVVVSSTVESVMDEAFAENNSLIDIYCKCPTLGYRMFYTCPNIENVILENTVTISDYAFCNPNNGTTNISNLVLPEGLIKIGTYAFTRSALTELVLPSTLETIGASAFLKNTNLKKIVVLGPVLGEAMFKNCSSLEELVVTKNFTTFSKDALSSVSQTSFITYYTGSEADAAAFKTAFQSYTTRFKDASYCSYEDYKSGNYTAKSFMFVYDCDLCQAAFDGNHPAQKDDGNCNTAVMCSVCKTYECVPAKEHANGERLAYTDLMAEGEYYFGCTNDGCTVGSTEKAPALFVCLGYSAQLDGNGIVREFLLNHDAIEKYKELVDSNFEYGLVVAIENKAPLKIDESGKTATANGSVLLANFTNSSFNKVQVKISGIPSSAIEALIVNTIYARNNDEIYYANIGEMSKIAEGKSYSDLNTEE